MHASPRLRDMPGLRAGTLTLNQLSVDKNSCLVMPGYDINEAMKYGALSANIVSEEPIDMVLHESYEGNKTLWDDYTLEKFVPFNPTDKYTIAIVKEKANGKEHRIMKGAPQVGAARPPMLPSSPVGRAGSVSGPRSSCRKIYAQLVAASSRTLCDLQLMLSHCCFRSLRCARWPEHHPGKASQCGIALELVRQ